MASWPSSTLAGGSNPCRADPSITDYITPAPPFMAGTNVLDKAISDIWAKRHQDEADRIAAAAQEAQASFQQGQLQNSAGTLVETSRHNRADEGYNRGLLQRDLNKQQMEYIEKVATAYNTGNPEVGDALGHLFGLPPQAMAAIAAQARSRGQGNANPSMGPEPGVTIGPRRPVAGPPSPEPSAWFAHHAGRSRSAQSRAGHPGGYGCGAGHEYSVASGRAWRACAGASCARTGSAGQPSACPG